MYQLALSKILVYALNRSHFILIKAHSDLAEAYIDFGCRDQAIDHLIIALKKNERLLSKYDNH